jgi:hypothetical protein
LNIGQTTDGFWLAKVSLNVMRNCGQLGTALLGVNAETIRLHAHLMLNS